MCHVSHFMRHVSLVMCHMSPVMCHLRPQPSSLANSPTMHSRLVHRDKIQKPNISFKTKFQTKKGGVLGLAILTSAILRLVVVGSWIEEILNERIHSFVLQERIFQCSQGCSTNTSVTDSLINWVSQPFPPNLRNTFTKLPYESHLSRHTSETLKKIVKNLKTRLHSSKNP